LRISGLQNILRGNPFFALLKDDDLLELASHFTVQFFEEHEPIFYGGDPGGAFYLIHSGSANVVAERGEAGRETVALLKPGAGFGEQALLLQTPRTHTVEAAEKLCVLKLPPEEFRRFIEKRPDLLTAMTAVARRYLELSFLRKTGALAVLTAAKTEEILEQIEECKFAAGEILFREGEPATRCYMVSQGQVRLTQSDRGEGQKTQIVGPGAVIGVVPLLEGTPQDAEARAESDCSTLSLARQALGEALRDDGGQRMLHELSIRHLREAGWEAHLEGAPPSARLVVRRTRLRFGPFAGHHAFATSDTPTLAGLACLATVRAKHGQAPMPREHIERRLRQTSSETLSSLGVLAEEQGYLARVLHLREEQLDPALCPFIAEWETRFATVLEATAGAVLLADPLAGPRELDRDEFTRKWNGKVLVLQLLREQPRQGMAFPRRFWDMLRSAQGGLGAALALTAGLHLLGLAAPLAAKWLIDGVLVTHDLSLFWLLLAGLAGAAIFQSGFWLARESFWADALGRVSYIEQTRFLRRIFSLPLRLLAGWSSSDLALRFQLTTQVLEVMARHGLRSCLDAVAIVMAMAVLPLLSVRLALLALTCLAGYAVLLWYASPGLKRMNQQAFQAQQEFERLARESLAGILKVKSLTAEEPITESGERLIVQKKARELKAAIGGERTSALAAFLNQAAMLAILTYGAVLGLRGQMTAGSLVASIGLFAGMLAPMAALVRLGNDVQEARESLARIDELERLASETPQGGVATELKGHVEFRDVRFRYPGSPSDVLNGVSFSVLPGKKVAIVGRSGAGKSTLVNLLAGLYEPSGGAVLLDGADLRNLHPATLRRQMGVVEQDLFLFSGTVRANIAMAEPDAATERVVAAARLAGAHDFIQALPRGYDTDVGELDSALSQGQVQRIAIARAILTSPRIVLLDEATASLDLETARAVESNLESALGGTTMFIVGHRLATVRNADSIVVLDGGRVVESGSHAELMGRRGLYYYLNGGTA
jgi:ATP-binding cassette subfamily B protein